MPTRTDAHLPIAHDAVHATIAEPAIFPATSVLAYIKSTHRTCESMIFLLFLLTAFIGCGKERDVADAVSSAAIEIYSTDHVFYDSKLEGVFSVNEISILRENSESLLPMILDALDKGDSVLGAKFAADFNLTGAIGALKSRIAQPYRCYGWEGPDYTNEENFIQDFQFMHSISYIAAYEKLTKNSIGKSLNLDKDQLRQIQLLSKNKDSEYHYWALWMLRKLSK